MWRPFADGDLVLNSPSGIAALGVAAILVVGVVLVAWLRSRRKDASDDEIREAVKSAAGASVNEVAAAMSAVIVQLQAKVAELEALLDKAYRQGFDPDEPRAPVSRGGSGDD